MKYLLFLGCMTIIGTGLVSAVNLDQCQTKNLIITAYYSPQKGQAFYIHGSYEAEIRMNGEGIYGASGKQVYDGMLAGSNQYPFDTLVVIPKVGHGQIQDRGAAIVSNLSSTGSDTEYIDIRVGKGTAGLMRALTWGRQQKKGYICPNQKSSTIGFEINKMPSYKYFFDVTLWTQRMSENRKDQRVEALQKYLRKLGYLRQENIHGNYNTTTVQAVCSFQVKYNILKANDPLCGVFGPKTSFAIKKEAQVRGLLPDDLYTLTTLEPIITYLPSTSGSQSLQSGDTITIDDTKDSKILLASPQMIQDANKLVGVRHHFYRYYKPNEINTEIIFLQQFLQKNGYYIGKINGINSEQTKEALYQFQLVFKLLTTKSDPMLRGFLGPKTRDLINKAEIQE